MCGFIHTQVDNIYTYPLCCRYCCDLQNKQNELYDCYYLNGKYNLFIVTIFKMETQKIQLNKLCDLSPCVCDTKEELLNKLYKLKL